MKGGKKVRTKVLVEILVLVLSAFSVNVLGDNVVVDRTAGYGSMASFDGMSMVTRAGFQVSGSVSTPLNAGAQLGITGGPLSLFSESSFRGAIQLTLSNVSSLLDGVLASVNLDANSNTYAVRATETWNFPIALIFFATVVSIFGLFACAGVLHLAAPA